VVTGADRGIGFEVCRQLGKRGYAVVLTCPDPIRGAAAMKKLLREGIDVRYKALDVLSESQIRAVRRFVLAKFGRIDVLVNNAGVMLDVGHSRLEGMLARRLKKSPGMRDYGEAKHILEVDLDIVRATLEVNTLGPLRMCQAFVPLMVKAGYGRVVNVSSRLGQLYDMADEDTVPAYQLSKTALNAVTRMVADDCRGKNVAVNSVCPGWTRTELGGPRAPQTTEQASRTIVWLAMQPDGGPTGGFFAEKKRIAW
jgi:NAD(P)-dependent dehydrogenase (short-subunit alcohol dehydrogenase family)